MKKSLIGIMVVVFLISMTLTGVGCKEEAETAEETVVEAETVEEVEEVEEAEEAVGEEIVTLQFANDKGWTDRNDDLSPYSEEAIGVAIESVSYPDPAEYQALMKQSMATDSGPDFLNWWSGYRLKDLVDLDLLEDLSDIWQKHIDAGEYDPSVAEGFKLDGKYYGSLYHSNLWVVLYNKTIFDEYNLEEPQTWEEFISICDTLKAGGKTPISSYLDGRWYSLAWFEEILIRTDPALYEGVCDFSIEYSDPRVVDALKVWQDMIVKGYFPEDQMIGFADWLKNFATGETAMLLIGDWVIGNLEPLDFKQGEDYDCFVVPMIDPTAEKTIIFETGPLIVAKKSPHLEETKELFDYWLSPEAQTVWAETWDFATPNLKATVPDRPIFNKYSELNLNTGEYRYLTRFYENTPVPVCEFALDKFAEIMLNPDRLEAALAEIDEFIKTQ